eukprot:UN1610
MPNPLVAVLDGCEDWGKTGDRSSRDDKYHILVVGNGLAKLGIHWQYSLLGPDYDDSDYESEADATEEWCFWAYTMDDRVVEKVWATSKTDEQETKAVIMGAFYDAGDPYCELRMADGKVTVDKWNKRAISGFLNKAQYDKPLEAILARAVLMCSANARCPEMRRAFRQKTRIAKQAVPLFRAFQAIATSDADIALDDEGEGSESSSNHK